MATNNENEVMIGQVIYVFASAGVARGFEACLSSGTLARCKIDYPPIAVYPPPGDDLAGVSLPPLVQSF